MIKLVVILLISILLITVIRAVVGVVMKGFTQLVGLGESPGARAGADNRPRVPVDGELKKDPVCGTFVAAATAVKATSGGKTVYFCSEECRGKWLK